MPKAVQLPSITVSITDGSSPATLPLTDIQGMAPAGLVSYSILNSGDEDLHLIRSDENHLSAVQIASGGTLESKTFSPFYRPCLAVVQASVIGFGAAAVEDAAADGVYSFELINSDGDAEEIAFTANTDTYGDVITGLISDLTTKVALEGSGLEAEADQAGATITIAPGGDRLYVPIQNLVSPASVMTLAQNTGEAVVTPYYHAPAE